MRRMLLRGAVALRLPIKETFDRHRPTVEEDVDSRTVGAGGRIRVQLRR